MFQLVLPMAAPVHNIDPSPPDIVICWKLFSNWKAVEYLLIVNIIQY